MASFVKSLFVAPKVNPVNNKAESIPFFNVFNVYGRVFFFSWFGFFLAFWSWYAFPPLLSDVIAKDMAFSKPQIANSNIIALVATLLVRLVAGPLCDLIGPRRTFALTLVAGAIPTFCAGGITNVSGLYAIRFFIGILGGSFVPCQVWATGFFDKPIVGLANSLAAGLGNSGGGVTYFVMPAIYNALRGDGESPHVAWRVAFVVPGCLILAVAACLFLFCPDTPTGNWEKRFEAVETNLRRHSIVGVVDIPGALTTEKNDSTGAVSDNASGDIDKKEDMLPSQHDPEKFSPNEAHLSTEEMVETAKGEVVRKPTFSETMKVILSLQTLVTGACYFCSFGTELSVNSTLGTWYTANFAAEGFGKNPQIAGNWAAMFGLLNIVCRPLGGIAADIAYRSTKSVWAKKVLLHTYALITGGFLIAIGVLNSHNEATMFGLIAGMAFFLEGGNGVNFALVPHVHPYANGVVSGFTGAMGNFGGIIFALIFRYNLTNYGRSTWIIGVITIAINIAVSWIRPIPKGQIGGH